MLYDLSVSSPVPFSSLWRVLVPAGTADASNVNAALAECDELNSVTTNVVFVALPDRDEHIQAVCHKVCAATLAEHIPRNLRRKSCCPKWPLSTVIQGQAAKVYTFLRDRLKTQGRSMAVSYCRLRYDYYL